MLPILLALAATATAQSTTVESMFGFLGVSYLASVISVESSTTTLHLECPSVTAGPSPTDDPENNDTDYACFDSTLLITTASDYFGAVLSDGGATGTFQCSLGGTTLAACSQIYTSTDTEDNPSQTGETVVTTLSAPADFEFGPVTITAGLEKLGGGTGAVQTGSVTMSAPQSGSKTSSGPAQTNTPGAAALGVVPAAGFAVGLGAAVAAVVL